MIINANTKIAAVLKQHPDALEAIISISPKFEKLRNPLLRKLMAGRTSIAMASKISGCTENDFFKKLEPLGFEVNRTMATEVITEVKKLPIFFRKVKPEQIVELDVRQVIDSGKDPLNLIIQKVKTIQPGQVLKIINTFEPTPLMSLLKKQGFESFADRISDNLVETYFYKGESAFAGIPSEQKPANNNDWDELLKQYDGRIQNVDVRHLEMPQPMLTILAELDKLPIGYALFVHHKRIPVFLLPELNERGFDYRIKEVSDNEVYLLIFKS